MGKLGICHRRIGRQFVGAAVCCVVERAGLNGAVVAAHRTALEASRVKPKVVRTELAVAAVPGGRRHGWCSGRRVGRQELRSIKQRKSRREKLNCLVVVWLSV